MKSLKNRQIWLGIIIIVSVILVIAAFASWWYYDQNSQDSYKAYKANLEIIHQCNERIAGKPKFATNYCYCNCLKNSHSKQEFLSRVDSSMCDQMD
jgi:hypothetical protein